MRFSLPFLTGAALPTLILTASAAVAQTTPDVINVPGDPVPDQVLADQTLNLYDGGEIDDYFTVNSNGTLNVYGGRINGFLLAEQLSTVNISGGEVNGDFKALQDATVNITDGHVESLALADSTGHITGGTFTYVNAGYDSTLLIDGDPTIETLYAFSSNTMHLTGGTITERIHLAENNTLHMHGGSISSNIVSHSQNSQFIISGGSFEGNVDPYQYYGKILIRGGDIGGRIILTEGSRTTISGGNLLPELILKLEDEFATLNFIGQSFTLDGVSLTDDMLTGESLLITDRNVMLQGILADGSSIQLDLNGSDYDKDAQLTITLIPEPTTLVLLGVGSCYVLKRRDKKLSQL